MAEWKLEALKIIKIHERHPGFRLLEEGAGSVSRYIQRQCERQDMVIHSLWHSLQEAVKACLLHKDYQMTSSRVAHLCLLAGCPSSARNPFRNVELLREHTASRPSAMREAELRREIEELRRESLLQQRIITNLTFRHLLENLPPATTKHRSATVRWTDFFRDALKKVQNQSQMNSQPHPFDALLHKYTNTTQIETVGTGLYGTLSTNIHHFSSQYTILGDQWNALEYEIMQALTPIPSNIPAGEPDWQKERQRY